MKSYSVDPCIHYSFNHAGILGDIIEYRFFPSAFPELTGHLIDKIGYLAELPAVRRFIDDLHSDNIGISGICLSGIGIDVVYKL